MGGRRERGRPTFAAGDLLAKSELYDTESRTGIAIDSKRKVQEGKIYTAAHIRLRPEVTLLIGLDSDPGLQKKGRLFLGGEQRICGYATAAAPALPQGEAALRTALRSRASRARRPRSCTG